MQLVLLGRNNRTRAFSSPPSLPLPPHSLPLPPLPPLITPYAIYFGLSRSTSNSCRHQSDESYIDRRRIAYTVRRVRAWYTQDEQKTDTPLDGWNSQYGVDSTIRDGNAATTSLHQSSPSAIQHFDHFQEAREAAACIVDACRMEIKVELFRMT